MADPLDDYADVTLNAIRIRHSVDPRFLVFITGASVLMSAMDDRALYERAIGDAIGEPVALHDLTAAALRSWESMNLLDMAIPEGTRGVVVLDMTMSHLSLGREALQELLDQPRVGFSGAAFEQEVRTLGLDVPRKTGVHFIDHFGFFASRLKLLANLVTGPIDRGRHPFEKPLSAERLAERFNGVRQRMLGYEANREANAAMYARFVRMIRGRGRYEVLLVAPPYNPAQIDRIASAERRADYLRFARDMAAELDVTFYDPNPQLDAVDAEFVDYGHVRAPALRKRYSDLLRAKIIELARSMKEAQQ
jgi:hypothetical protein